jgi:hypothetical protein
MFVFVQFQSCTTPQYAEHPVQDFDPVRPAISKLPTSQLHFHCHAEVALFAMTAFNCVAVYLPGL